ncbi:membrane hypothetical protein [Candidatus Xenohaliotis californiensis]|uniref:Uncharacterized protein n=1 Tax=Candidatus Xenohaliotis californiensis TaxID=84677 RepID=A0ABP0EV32_9RICK|nr:membrane hypothetical protein [Candidatus Xenohaliotis californiensis]
MTAMNLIIGDLLAIIILTAIAFTGFKLLPIEIFAILAIVALASLIFMTVSIFPVITIALSSITIFKTGPIVQIVASILGVITLKSKLLPYLMEKSNLTANLHNNTGIKKHITNILELIFCSITVTCIIFLLPLTISAIVSHVAIFLGIAILTDSVVRLISQHIQPIETTKENTAPIIEKDEPEHLPIQEDGVPKTISKQDNETKSMASDTQSSLESDRQTQTTDQSNLDNKQSNLPQSKISDIKQDLSIQKNATEPII